MFKQKCNTWKHTHTQFNLWNTCLFKICLVKIAEMYQIIFKQKCPKVWKKRKKYTRFRNRNFKSPLASRPQEATLTYLQKLSKHLPVIWLTISIKFRSIDFPKGVQFGNIGTYIQNPKKVKGGPKHFQRSQICKGWYAR
jgi:hypothetical protein